MAVLDAWSPNHSRKKSDKERPKTYGIDAARRNLARWREYGAIGAIAWFFFSLYPLFQYFTQTSIVERSTTQHIEVTKTVVAPPIESTALPGSLSYTKYNPKRISDVTDVFADYKKSANCTISSLELHGAFEPLCKTKDSLLEAMSTGGRLGFDAPFSPRGCDMRWYSNDEICGILTKFEKIFILGDSMMRNVAVALSIIQRKDLVNGGRTTWASAGEGVDCRCAGPFETSKCAFYSTVSSRVIYREDPQSMYCNKKGRGGFEYDAWLQYPIKPEDMAKFVESLSDDKPRKPYAFVMGHGLWNDLEIDKTYAWIDQAIQGITDAAPYLKARNAFFPRLFLGPNAAGIRKPEIFIARQGNLALTKFEHALKPFCDDRGVDFLGTYNATIQTNNPDGTHGGMRNNLLKAMMVFNWLDSLDVNKHYD